MFLSAQAAEHASSVAEIVATEQVASLALFVGQVSPWGLHHTDDTTVDVRHCHRALNEKKDSGNWGKRRNEDLKGELTAKVLQRANASHKVRFSPSGQSAQGDAATEHARVNHGHTAVSANREFCLDTALAGMFADLARVNHRATIMARIVDHAFSSPQSISKRMAIMFQQAGSQTVADLFNDQPIDACGYIAADVVCRLREAALAQGNSWLNAALPDYSKTQCVSKGNVALRRHDGHEASILESDDVNRLVRSYSFLDTRSSASEEWWAGAVALDHFVP